MRRRHRGRRSERPTETCAGMTLIELLIVVAIIGSLLMAFGFSLEGWISGYKMESQAKQIYADLMNSRLRAMEKARVHFAKGTSGSYSIYEDTNPSPDGDGVLQTSSDNLLPGYPKTADYNLDWSGIGTTITFDKKGLISPSGTLTLNSTSAISSDYNCIMLAQTRITIGRWDGTNCVIK